MSTDRRHFLKRGVAMAATITCWPHGASRAAGGEPRPDWDKALEDPVRAMFPQAPDLDKILTLFPRTQGPPAFDPRRIHEAVQALRTDPSVNTGHPFLDLSVKTGLAHIDATFRGDHPKYGVGSYAEDRHDGFPPTIIAAVDALSAWGLHRRARQLFRYWLATFVKGDGTINYYGPSLSEYGQLLHTAALLAERAGTADWWSEGFPALERMAELLLRLRHDAERQADAGRHGQAASNASQSPGRGLISGVPEADTRKDTARYFHNNAWVVKGLRRWAGLCERQRAAPATAIATVREVCDALARDTLEAIQAAWPADQADWWLTPQVEPLARPARLTATTDYASYTNYRYWPELLSSGLLPREMANRVVDARLAAGGQFCGMTRFAGRLDDWPLAEYLSGLWSLGRKNDFLLSLYGHVAYHQAEGHLTAYEQVSFPPGRKWADYCLPCQLVAARSARLLQA